VEMLKQWKLTRIVFLVGYTQCTNMSNEIRRYLMEGPRMIVLNEGSLARMEISKVFKSLSKVNMRRKMLSVEHYYLQRHDQSIISVLQMCYFWITNF
jgi:hypothetical protein